MIVIDASLMLAWLFKNKNDDYAVKSLRRFERGFAPSFWTMEVMNGLIVARRKGRMTPAVLRSYFADIDNFPITVEGALFGCVKEDILNLALKHKMSAYSATYLELAMRRGLPLGTLDERLREACAKERVPIAFL